MCQAALGLKPKQDERVTVFVKTADSPELAIGTLRMGSCDQFSLGTGLTFSSGETVTVRHTGSTSVFLTGRIEDDFDDDFPMSDSDGEGDDGKPSEPPAKAAKAKAKAAPAPAPAA